MNTAFGPSHNKFTCMECKKELTQPLCEQHPDAGSALEGVTKIEVSTLQVQVNPFAFIEANDFLEQRVVPGTESEIFGPPKLESILSYLCGQGVSSQSEKICQRYKDTQTSKLGLVPNTKFFANKLIEPLREAQTSYMIGNWIATIALCGVTCEMLTMLIFEMSRKYIQINGKSIDEESIQKAVFGTTFEKLTQEGKLRLLLNLGVIDEGMHSSLDKVRSVRNQYIHYYDYNADPETRRKQALDLLTQTTEVTQNLTVVGYSNGSVILHPALLQYLKDAGELPKT